MDIHQLMLVELLFARFLEDCDDVQKVYTNADIPDEMVGRA